MQKKVTEIKLKEYAPIKDNICIDSIDQDQVYEIKFHGKPVNKLPLKNSKIEKVKEKCKIKEIFCFANTPADKTAKPKNIDKNNGIKIKEKGIKVLKASS